MQWNNFHCINLNVHLSRLKPHWEYLNGVRGSQPKQWWWESYAQKLLKARQGCKDVLLTGLQWWVTQQRAHAARCIKGTCRLGKTVKVTYVLALRKFPVVVSHLHEPYSRACISYVYTIAAINLEQFNIHGTCKWTMTAGCSQWPLFAIFALWRKTYAPIVRLVWEI